MTWIYLLAHNTAQRPVDSEVTFKLVSPENLFSFKLWDAQEREVLPEGRPVFYSFAEPFDTIDYPTNDEELHILSERAIAGLQQVSNQHGCQRSRLTVINAMMDELNDPRDGLHDDQDIIRESLRFPRYFSEKFYAVKPPVIEGLFDWEQSQYSLASSGSLSLVRQFVFHTPKEPLPPIFTLAEWQGNVFITEELRNQWKGAEITGTAYNLPEQPWLPPIVDVELP